MIVHYSCGHSQESGPLRCPDCGALPGANHISGAQRQTDVLWAELCTAKRDLVAAERRAAHWQERCEDAQRQLRAAMNGYKAEAKP